MKYRVVSILKDNRPRFLIISDIEEIEILPSKYLKHLDQINASPNTVKSAAFALSYYYNFLQEQTIGLDEIILLSYSEQNKHFIDFLYWVKSGKHTEHNTQTSNKTCNMYLGAVFRYYQFLELEDVLPMLKVLRVKKVSYFDSIIKKILYSHCQTKAMGSIKGELRGFRRFASFMYDRFPGVKHFTEISRDMIEDYLVYIKTDTGLTSVSYTTELSVLDNLLDEIGRELEIGNICNLFLSSDCRAYDNALPEAYSDAEIRRFNCALTKLKPQLGRCLIIHQMLGTRIEDTLTLRRDCLSEKSGHYFITIIQQKTRKYKRPVSDQLAELIRKAIEVSEKEHPDSEYIFLQDNGKLYTDSMLKYHVNIMIYENDIRDDNGNYFEFRTHRFRHTFGVKLTEMKLDDDSIARLLGHKDTRTIPHYRRLRNESLAEDTKAVRDEMNELLAQYRREKENAETR